MRVIAYARSTNKGQNPATMRENSGPAAPQTPRPRTTGANPMAAGNPRYPTFVGIPLFRKDGSIRAWTIVDVEDATLGVHRWYLGSRGYAQRQLRQPGRNSARAELMHRRLLGLGRGDPRQSDHINRGKLDNRRANLRIVDQTQNNQNLPGGRGRSGHYGVHWIAARNCWAVRFILNGKWVWGGYFENVEKAAIHAQSLRARMSPYSFEAWNAR